jgi:hypothetical protein
MKTLILKIAPLLFLGLWPGLTGAQTITTTPGSVSNCPGDTVIPILVTNCNGVGAISLALFYDNTVLTYLGYQDVHPALNNGLLIINSTGSKVIFSWARTTAADVGNDTLVELKFTGITGTSALTWDTESGNCEYSDITGNILPSTYIEGSATFWQIPQINTQPTNETVLVGLNTSFSVSAIATGIEYQWQGSINGGDTWGDLINGTPYSGVTTATLSITDALLSYNGYMYRCKITGDCDPEVYTDEVTLTVINPITTTLPTTSVCPGNIIIPATVTNFNGVAAFSLTFSYNISFLTYTGYQALNGALSGGTFTANASGGSLFMSWYSTSAASFGDGTIVELLFSTSTGTSSLTWDTETAGNCEYTDINGDQITPVFVNGNATLYGLPAVVTQPVDKIIAKGQNTSFSITASGSGLTYLWQVSVDNGENYSDLSNGGYYSNVTTATMNVSGAQLILKGNLYRCKVTGTCPPIVYSDPAELTVLPNVITTCKTVAGCPGQIAVPVTVTDFIDVGSFSLTLAFSQSVLTYTGYQDVNTALNSGTLSVNASNGKVYFTWYSTTLATIAGGDTLIQILFNGIPGSSALTWDIQTPGNCEYSDENGLPLFTTWTNGNATIYQPPVINTHPVNKTMYAGGSTTFSVSASGTGLGYLWQVSTDGGDNWSNLSNGSPYSGVTTATLTVNPVGVGLNGYKYRCYVTGTCTPFIYSNPAQLTVIPAAVTTTAVGVSNSCKRNLVIPVVVTNCTNIGAISLTMNYDPSKLTFDGYQTVNSELSTGFFMVNPLATQVKLSWASTDPANIGSGTLIEYRFIANASISTTLSWDTQTPGNCEYTDVTGLVITSFYNSGTISVASNALLVNAGNDTIIISGGSAQLNGSVTGGVSPYTYLWTPSTGLSNPSILNPVASPTSTTIYTLTVTGNNGCSGQNSVTVSVAASRTWIGVINEDWNVAGNWSPSGIPISLDNVIIPASATYMPEVHVNGMSCYNLYIDPNATLTIKAGFTLTVHNDFTIGSP